MSKVQNLKLMALAGAILLALMAGQPERNSLEQVGYNPMPTPHVRLLVFSG